MVYTKLFNKMLWFLAGAATLAFATGCGKAVPLSYKNLIGSAVVEGTGGTRVDGSDIGDIYPVTTIVAATAANPYPTLNDLPFTGRLPGVISGASTGAVTIGSPVTDGQTYFYFQYTYPPNNYLLNEAHLVLDVLRDNSDTEGIFVAGVLSGNAPLSMVDLASPHISCPMYNGYGGALPACYNGVGPFVPNIYYNNFQIGHYKIGLFNSIDLNLLDLLNLTTILPVDLIKVGKLPVVLGDDSRCNQANLVLNGFTISKTPLTCANSATYSFTNTFVHNDFQSDPTAHPFSGTTYSPFASKALADGAFRSVEYYFDEQLPKVDVANITLSSAQINLKVKRCTANTAKAAIVINGYGISQAGFDQTTATAVVEAWDAGTGTTYWNNWVNAIVANCTLTGTLTIDLLQLLGAAKLRDLLAQGKFNVSLAGSVAWVDASAATSTRAPGVAVSGPELVLNGNYFTQVCTIPNDPSSPLSDSAGIPSGLGDHVSPLISSMSAVSITSSSATIQWLTNEPADGQVGYGVGNTNTLTAKDTTLKVFHQIQLTGLQPYRVYTYTVYTSDSSANQTVSGIAMFQTLR